jgi:hypothetical protein
MTGFKRVREDEKNGSIPVSGDLQKKLLQIRTRPALGHHPRPGKGGRVYRHDLPAQHRQGAGKGQGAAANCQQGMGAAGLKTMSDYGAQQQAQGQKLLDYPMAQTQQFAKLLQGYQMPMGTTTQATGSEGYSNSPLSQIGGLGTLLASLYYGPQVKKEAEGGEIKKAHGGGVRLADGGMAPSGAEYHDGNGNFLRCQWLLSGVKNGTSNRRLEPSLCTTKTSRTGWQ